MSQTAKESDALLDLLAKPIAFHPVFVKIAGSVAAGVMLSQAFYWSKNRRAVEREGWFYKSHTEWEDETGLTRREQQTARMHLRTKGLLEEKDGTLPGRGRVLWYRVNRADLFRRLKEFVGAEVASSDEPSEVDVAGGCDAAVGSHNAQTLHESARPVAPERPTSVHESAQGVAPNRPTPLITSETTAESTHTRGPRGPPRRRRSGGWCGCFGLLPSIPRRIR